MTLPGGASNIPLHASGPSRPGMRPAGTRPAPPRSTPQNAFTMALAQAQAQNQAFRNAAAAMPNAYSYPQQDGLPFDLQGLSQNGLPLAFQAMAQKATPVVRPGAIPTVNPASAGIQVPGGFGPIVEQAAQKYGVEPALIAAVMETESRFNPDAVSGAGARGLMQLMPATARGLGVTDASDPLQNVMGGAKLLGFLTQKYGGNLELALAAYNAGSGAVDKHGGIPPYGETRKYVPLVLSAYERFKSQAGAATPAAPATTAVTAARR